MDWSWKQEKCWEPIITSPGLGTEQCRMAVGAAEVREAGGSGYSVVEKVRPAAGADVGCEGKIRVKASGPPLSQILSLTLSSYQTLSAHFPGPQACPLLLHPSICTLPTK